MLILSVSLQFWYTTAKVRTSSVLKIRSLITNPITVASLGAQMVKNPPAMQETGV